ncbi:MarR family transcriptional regulator [Desulforhopalus singaporensis]|uniref:MarR family transcriptional regulator n=1 Tax=Desulforhopalus singaporensis TaxID=91360 RepID=UPI001C40B855|nr:MarR family transcriptional regulator [Desulforhopalus singaporensis]
MDSRNVIQGYGISDTNCIEQIGSTENLNVTKIAKKLHLTRGAVSKIIKKLISSGDVISYQHDENKKEIYYKLTEKGRLLYKEHHRRHKAWEERDLKFFNEIQEKELEVVCNFMNSFNKYLDKEIKKLK